MTREERGSSAKKKRRTSTSSAKGESEATLDGQREARALGPWSTTARAREERARAHAHASASGKRTREEEEKGSFRALFVDCRTVDDDEAFEAWEREMRAAGEALRECPCAEKDWESVGAMEGAQGESNAWESENIWQYLQRVLQNSIVRKIS